jgi:hypothetical protein
MGVLGGLTVDDDVNVSLDVRENAPHPFALALLLFAVDGGSGSDCRFGGVVNGLVVKHVADNRRHDPPKTGDHTRNRGFLVEQGTTWAIRGTALGIRAGS